MRPITKLFSILCVGALLPVSGAFAQDDGVASLPVFKGPFPETVNMRFLSQIDPEDLGALEVPGVWAKGMMNDIGGWTSPSGEEYALATNSGGIAIVRVTDPENPEFLGRVESQNPLNFANIWGDPATFSTYAYFTTEIDDSSSFDFALARSAVTLSVPSGSTILEVLRENGVPVPSSCEQGACGTCVATVLEGKPDHQDVHLTDSERQAGDRIMTCVSRAKSDRLVLDL